MGLRRNAIVAGGGRIVHDPAPEGGGLVGPMDDGWYWVTYVGALRGIVE